MIRKLFPFKTDSATDERLFQHNLRVHIGDGSIYAFALSLITVPTIVPVLLQQLGASTSAIGAVPVLWNLGLNLPQGFYVHWAKPKTSVKYRMISYGTAHRFFFFLIGMVTFLFGAGAHAQYAVPGVLLCLMLSSVTGSIGGLQWFHLYAATTPVNLRGRLTALRQLIGSFIGILGGSVVSVVLAVITFPLNFSILFFVASALMMVSIYILSHLRLPERVQMASAPEAKIDLIREGKRILSADKNFKSYLVADALLLMSMTASAFYAVYAIERFSLNASYAGTFTVIMMASTVIANIIFGILADSMGNRVNLMAMALSSAFGSISAVLAGNVLAYGVVFFFMAASIALQGISRLTFIAELCTEAERPVYVALANTLTAPTIFIGILLGALIPSMGYPAVLLIAAALGIVSFIIILTRVAEPRHRATIQ
ncbi:MAG: MFS transporter [Acidobacteriota bacterium]